MELKNSSNLKKFESRQAKVSISTMDFSSSSTKDNVNNSSLVHSYSKVDGF